jgi:hypothetical protein
MSQKKVLGRPPKKKETTEAALAAFNAKRLKELNTTSMIDALRGVTIKPPSTEEIADLIENENWVRFYAEFKDLLDQNKNAPTLIGSSHQIAFFYQLYILYAGTSGLMERMLNSALRTGIGEILQLESLKDRSKDRQEEAAKKHRAICDAYDKYVELHLGKEPSWGEIKKAVERKGFIRCGKHLIEDVIRTHKKSFS